MQQLSFWRILYLVQNPYQIPFSIQNCIVSSLRMVTFALLSRKHLLNSQLKVDPLKGWCIPTETEDNFPMITGQTKTNTLAVRVQTG